MALPLERTFSLLLENFELCARERFHLYQRLLCLCFALFLRIKHFLQCRFCESHGNKEKNDLRRKDAKPSYTDCLLALPAHA